MDLPHFRGHWSDSQSRFNTAVTKMTNVLCFRPGRGILGHVTERFGMVVASETGRIRRNGPAARTKWETGMQQYAARRDGEALENGSEMQ